MNINSFNAFQEEVNLLQKDGKYTRALELITSKKENFPSKYGLINYWMISLYSLTGDTAQSLKIFEQTLSTGFWYSDLLLRKNADLKSLQGLEHFENLIKINKKNRTLDESHLFPLLILRSEGSCISSAEPCPLLVGIHANYTTAADSLEFWRAATKNSYLVAAPQSSQALWKGAYIWEDLVASSTEIIGHLQSLGDKFEIDPGDSIISGIRQGAEICIKLALSGKIQVKGFILINPDLSFLLHTDLFTLGMEPIYLDDKGEIDLRGYIIKAAEIESLGEDTLEAFMDSMVELGIKCKLDFVPHAGYEYVPDYDQYLLTAIDFIVQA